MAHFLGQAMHESGDFTTVTENLNYSANRLLKVFPKYFKTLADAQRYANNPQAIGNRVYGNRMGNGNEASGDGYKYRGRGYIQLTGKDNYREFAKYIGVDVVNNPDLVATRYPFESAIFFFDKNNIWKMADAGVGISTITKLTKKINGGYNGLQDRIAKTNKVYKLLA